MSALATCGTAAPADARRYDAVALMRAHAGVVAALAASAWWLIEVTRSWAGWDAPSVTVGAALIAVAVVLVRPDRVLPPLATALAVATSAGAFIVPLAAPTGWTGARGAASYVCVAWLCVTVAAVVVRRPETRTWFAVLVAFSVPIEFLSGWTGWWGGNDPSHAMVGTFYWHNPYAAYLIPGGLIGLAFLVWRTRVFALLGLICFTFASIGIWYSTSRAGLATFVLGVVLIGLAAAVSAERWRALRRLVLGAAIAAGGTFFLAGPPFFSHRVSPLAAAQVRTATQPLGQNTDQRLDFWREALTVFRHNPITGGGYKSLVSESLGRVPSDWPLSPFAHNGYLQAVGEGGLVLALPFLLGVGWIVWFSLRFFVTSLRTRRPSISRYAVPVALGCALLHSAVDFDWIYPASFALAGILGGLVLGCAVTPREASPALAAEAAPAADETVGDPAEPAENRKTGTVGRPGAYVRAAASLVGVALLLLAAVEMRHGDHHYTLPTRGHLVGQAAPDSGR